MEMAKNMRARCALWIVLAGLAWSLQAPHVDSQEAPAVGNIVSNRPIAFYGDGYVLLQHGSVLHGFVKPQADKITIVLEKGKEVTLANKQVLTIGKTMESLYEYQIRGIRKWGTGEHWHLAQWCIQNGLMDQAIEHYSELEKVASDNPRFKQLDLQLKQALLGDEKVRQAMAEQGISVPDSEAGSTNQKDTNPLHEPKRWTSGRRTETTMASEVTPATAQRPLGEAQRILPSYIRRSFQTEIQPVVVSRCGQSGCHGMLAKNDFQVFQPVGDQAATITERNLESILGYVDTESSLQSTLINYATRPHGSQRNPSINPNRDEDRVLLDKMLRWLKTLDDPANDRIGGSHVISAAANDPQANLASNVAPAIALVPKSAIQRSQQQRRNGGMERIIGDSVAEDRSAKLSKPAKSAPPPVVLNAAELQELESAISKLEKMELGSKAQRDPLDPNEFNTKYSTGAPNKR
jgi:hypothetical protein